MDYEETQNIFHYKMGTYLSATIFLEYSLFLKETIDTSIKGNTTRKNRLIEAEAAVNRLVKYLREDLIAIGCDMGICQDEITKLETLFYDVLSLSETDQNRVRGLITKLNREKQLQLA
jgi:hypothetical protein